MSKWLSTIKVITVAGCLAMSACATVDMTEISSPSAKASANTVDVNVVQRAASKLYSVFTNKGFVEKTSRNKMRSAARMLLKGLEKTPLGSEANYAEAVESLDVLKSDIIFAQGYVEQTRQAAEIYLAMAPGETSLKKELDSLQKALVAANAAKQTFSEALLLHGSDDKQAEFVSYCDDVKALSAVTDDFGVRVRALSLQAKTPTIG